MCQCPSQKNNSAQETCSAPAAHVSALNRRPGSKGQTLIETVVAVFILALGISTAMGLAIYSFQNTDNATRAIVGTSLAREAIEGVKNKRDSNWISDNLAGGLGASSCVFATSNITQPCDPNWANGLSSGDYTIDFNSQNPSSNISQDVLTPSSGPYNLLYCPSNGGVNANLFISSSASASVPACGVQPQTTIYSRKVTLNLGNLDPTTGQQFYFTDNSSIYPAFMDVVATVWWQSRNCPATNNPDTLSNSCKVVLESHLTNWRKLFQ
jgi:type II secretory pathway pseudopilin PulG